MLLLWLLLPLLELTAAQLQNHRPHFVAGTGDMSRFSLSEHTPVGSPVYQLKGKSKQLMFKSRFQPRYSNNSPNSHKAFHKPAIILIQHFGSKSPS